MGKNIEEYYSSVNDNSGVLLVFYKIVTICFGESIL